MYDLEFECDLYPAPLWLKYAMEILLCKGRNERNGDIANANYSLKSK